jgi:rhodanese-related sulfurtransferase
LTVKVCLDSTKDESMPPFLDLDRLALKQKLAMGSVILIDVREPHEFAAGFIPGSCCYPLSTFDAGALFKALALPAQEGHSLIFTCATGIRSRHAADFALAAGLPVLGHYTGGFKDWVIAGEDVALPAADT